eukprot:3543460-Alexandrium_andersonii.AAC.1
MPPFPPAAGWERGPLQATGRQGRPNTHFLPCRFAPPGALQPFPDKGLAPQPQTIGGSAREVPD